MSGAAEIQRTTLDNQAASAIRRRIVEGQIAPGERLTEIGLSEQYELSRGTIRSALRQLVSEGLVIQVPYTGWEVAPLTAKDAWELYTLRSALEALAAGLAADAIAHRGKNRLSKGMEEIRRACEKRDKKAAALADFNLHLMVIRLSGHTRLEEQYNLISRQVQRYIVTSDALLPDQFALVEQHQPMVDAILAGDRKRAELLARAHNEKEGQALVKHLQKMEEKSGNN
ncbi:GntR family transcriptional regulator [Roseibium sp. M-1]